MGLSTHVGKYNEGVPFLAALHVREFDGEEMIADGAAPTAKYVWKEKP